jgi:hypothetical protein
VNLNMNAILDVVVDTQPRAGTVDTKGMLSFQKLRLDQRSIEFLALVLELIGLLPKGHAELADQLLRAAQSQPRNIAEDDVERDWSTSTSTFSFTLRLSSTSTSTSLSDRHWN